MLGSQLGSLHCQWAHSADFTTYFFHASGIPKVQLWRWKCEQSISSLLLIRRVVWYWAMSSITRLSSSGPGCQERLSACSNTTVSSIANTRVARILAHLSAASGSSEKSNEVRFHRDVSCVGGPVFAKILHFCLRFPAIAVVGTFLCIGGDLPSLRLSVCSSRYLQLCPCN